MATERARSSRNWPHESRDPAPRKWLQFRRPPLRSALLLGVTIAYLLPLTQILYRVGDDGTLVYGAQRVSEGAIPGRDFVEVMGPGSFYWLGFFFKFFGMGWQVTRLQLLFTGVATVFLLYCIARQVCTESAALLLWMFVLIVGMPLWPATSHHWDSNLFVVLAVWCYLKLEKTDHPMWAVAAGAVAGITTCFMQQKGLLLLLGIAASAILRRLWLQRCESGLPTEGTALPTRRQTNWLALWLLLGSYAALGIVVMAAFWRAGALGDLFYANVIWPLSGYHDINVTPYGQLLMSVAVGPGFQVLSAHSAIIGFICASLSLIPFLVIGGVPLLSAGLVLTLASAKRWSPCVGLVLAGASLWLSEIHRKDVFHLTYGSPLLLIALLASTRFISSASLRKAIMGTLAAGLVVFGTLNFVVHLRGRHAVETRRGTINSVSNDEALNFLTSVKERDFVFIYPYYPMYYYLANVRNPTRLSLVLYGYNTPEQFDEVIRNLEEKHVQHVLWDTEVYGDKLRRWFPAYRQPAANELKLEAYLQQNYDEVGMKSGFRVLERRGNPADSPAFDAGFTTTGAIQKDNVYAAR